MATISERPLIVIVGPTASGKTKLAIDLAIHSGGEIVCADSRTIYKYMDIGTAKPTIMERRGIKHWGLDLVEPGQRYSVADFKQYALKKIDEIRERNNIPILVGGTGLYIDSVIFDYSFAPKPDVGLREDLQGCSMEELYEICRKKSIKLPENYRNKRYVIRSIERSGFKLTKRQTPLPNTEIVGIETNMDELKNRIDERVEQMFNNGLVEETSLLVRKFGVGNDILSANAYPYVYKLIQREMNIDDVKKAISHLDYKLAKRQLTWLRRNHYIKWLSLEDAREYIFSMFDKQ